MNRELEVRRLFALPVTLTGPFEIGLSGTSSRRPQMLQLSVSVLPGDSELKVPLEPDTTAQQVVDFCQNLAELDGNELWALVADLGGFEKRFYPQERLYQLLRKQVLLAGSGDDVRFYLRKKKKRHSVCSLQEEGIYFPIAESRKDGYSSDLETSRPLRARPNPMMPVPEQNECIRVPQPPPQPSGGTMSYGQLVQMAERQRRQIETNKLSIEQKEARISVLKQNQRTAQAHASAANRLQMLRSNVSKDQAELQRLSALKESLAEEVSLNEGAKMELDRLQNLFSTKERELRQAVNKVDSLRAQLDQLQQRRQSAATAAAQMAREQRMASQKTQLTSKQTELRTIDDHINSLIGRLRAPAEPRPRAAVEPFQVTPPPDSERLSPEQREEQKNEFVSSKGYSMVMSVVNKALAEKNLSNKPMDSADGYESISPQKPRVELFSGRREDPSSPSSSSSGEDRTSPNGTKSKVSRSINCQLKNIFQDGSMLLGDSEAPFPDLIPQSERTQPLDSDLFHIRSHTPRATKRRSWAHDATSDEADHIRHVLLREQQRGKSNINFRYIFDQSLQTSNEPSTSAQKETELKATEIALKPPPPYVHPAPPPPYAPPPYDLPPPYKDKSDESSTSDDSEKVTVIDVDPEFSLPSPPVKGILKGSTAPSRRPEGKRNIRFDPLAILLDAALEGELDLVKQSTDQLQNVSQSNDEGITALHNAICAGHYEIVRFLVEADADVNAQDSDGWTPLHCAASCNNLPMVKFLVERGACVFATTLSDHETPADKCEEEEDGFDGCSQFLINIQDKMGRMCEGRVCAAFAYEACREDELTMEQGAPLRVMQRDGDEKGWWWCRQEGGDREGYVPSNYLGLYPRLAAQKAAQTGPGMLEENKLDDENNNPKPMEAEE